MTRIAAKLGRRARRARGVGAPVPSLWFLTDPERTPDPAAAARRLPAGAAIVYRAFGVKGALATAQNLRRLTRARKQILLIGADAALALRVGADGIHLPERSMQLAPRLRRAHPRWLISTAAHGTPALIRSARLNLDAAVVSAVFASRSVSVTSAMGTVQFARLIRCADVPVIALGGVNARTARRLLGSGAAGLAAIDGLAAYQPTAQAPRI